MGLGGMHHGHHMGGRSHFGGGGHRGHFGVRAGVRHHHHPPRGRIRFGFGRRRHYYGVHHVHHTRAYYVGAVGAAPANQAQEPQIPPYTVIHETKSQFQTIKIVEFTNQVLASNSSNMNNQATKGAAIMGSSNTQGNNDNQPLFSNDNNNNNNNDEYAPPPYNPNSGESDQLEGAKPPGYNADNPLSTDGNNNNNDNNTTEEEKTKDAPMQVTTQTLVRARGLVLDNEIQFSQLDEQHYHNTLVHSAMDVLLSQSKNRNLRMLIIGGGDCAVIRELVKYDASVITEITMIEIDQMVVDTVKQWFPAMTEGLKDSRVNVVYIDANIWVKQQMDRNNTFNYDLIICDLTEDGTLCQPLVNEDFWNNLSNLLKTDINGNVEGIIIRNGYHKPLIKNRNNDIILNNQYFISTHLPTFGGQYCFTILSHNALFGNLTDFTNVNPLIKDKNGNNDINTKVSIASPEELEYSYNYYYYNPIPEEPWYQRYGGWIILSIIVLIILIIIFS